ncbi:hypothetical protein EV210_114136 [Anaerospora hongkongensis]|uniref:Uncharacterized protein n=1 Tax=Anaerospora hongkongensis TaxID=244830 RepID=A0A4R1Q3F6_9FIRM|nr:hypothetical protein [Anaerospora hongkongensis]TCL35116.1 hypothetical protein EV210_114136 [Anaerospora hongkongensis]
MNGLKPWAQGPFDMLLHAETHFLKGEDFDRRIALISFDNCIEVAITTYLSLHPIQRGNREYKREDIDKWQRNYHNKLDFFYEELKRRNLTETIEQADIVYYHQNRNDQYHSGATGVPELHKLEGIRLAAIWIFEVLFGVAGTEQHLKEMVEAENRMSSPPLRELVKDRLIDAEYGMIEIGGIQFYSSEVLFSVDYQAYKEIGEELAASLDRKQEVINGDADNEAGNE